MYLHIVNNVAFFIELKKKEENKGKDTNLYDHKIEKKTFNIQYSSVIIVNRLKVSIFISELKVFI